MPFSAPEAKTALMVVDLQAGIVGHSPAHPVEDAAARCTELLAAFRLRGLPAVLVDVAGPPPGRTDRGHAAASASASLAEGFTGLIDELGLRPGDILVTKYARSVFSGTFLADRLKELGVTQVVVTGIAAGCAAGIATRIASGCGVEPAADAGGHSDTRVFPRIAEVGRTEDLPRLLEGRTS